MRYLIILLLGVSCVSTSRLKVIPTERPQEDFIMFSNCSGYVELDADTKEVVIRELYCQPYNFTTGEIFGEMVMAYQELRDGEQVAVIPLTELLRLREHLRRSNYVVGDNQELDQFIEKVDILLDSEGYYPEGMFQ